MIVELDQVEFPAQELSLAPHYLRNQGWIPLCVCFQPVHTGFTESIQLDAKYFVVDARETARIPTCPEGSQVVCFFLFFPYSCPITPFLFSP